MVGRSVVWNYVPGLTGVSGKADALTAASGAPSPLDLYHMDIHLRLLGPFFNNSTNATLKVSLLLNFEGPLASAEEVVMGPSRLPGRIAF